VEISILQIHSEKLLCLPKVILHSVCFNTKSMKSMICPVNVFFMYWCFKGWGLFMMVPLLQVTWEDLEQRNADGRMVISWVTSDTQRKGSGGHLVVYHLFITFWSMYRRMNCSPQTLQFPKHKRKMCTVTIKFKFGILETIQSNNGPQMKWVGQKQLSFNGNGCISEEMKLLEHEDDLTSTSFCLSCLVLSNRINFTHSCFG
jgi:hypothetical protein